MTSEWFQICCCIWHSQPYRCCTVCNHRVGDTIVEAQPTPEIQMSICVTKLLRLPKASYCQIRSFATVHLQIVVQVQLECLDDNQVHGCLWIPRSHNQTSIPVRHPQINSKFHELIETHSINRLIHETDGSCVVRNSRALDMKRKLE